MANKWHEYWLSYSVTIPMVHITNHSWLHLRIFSNTVFLKTTTHWSFRDVSRWNLFAIPELDKLHNSPLLLWIWVKGRQLAKMNPQHATDVSKEIRVFVNGYQCENPLVPQKQAFLLLSHGHFHSIWLTHDINVSKYIKQQNCQNTQHKVLLRNK